MFSDDIVVSFGSHLMNGNAEVQYHTSELGEGFPKIHFAKYQVDLSLNLSEQAGVHDPRPKAYSLRSRTILMAFVSYLRFSTGALAVHRTTREFA